MVTKSQIIGEIQRTARENGGRALGFRQFESETGIKRADWYGKYWARWGDAVSDAGLVPNELTGAYEESFLLEKYVQLARELGRLPASGDLRLKAVTTPDFPSNSTFEKLGTKSEFVDLLLKFCQSNGGYDDVVHMCKAYVPRRERSPGKTTIAEENFGFVYLVKSGRNFKIGRSNSSGRRQYELTMQLPERVKEIHVIRTDDPAGIEQYWHKRFETKRLNGEWFSLDAKDIAAFKRRKFM